MVTMLIVSDSEPMSRLLYEVLGKHLRIKVVAQAWTVNEATKAAAEANRLLSRSPCASFAGPQLADSTLGPGTRRRQSCRQGVSGRIAPLLYTGSVAVLLKYRDA